MIIKTNKPFGKVAGWIPLFKIGGTISKVNVLINKINEIDIITKETLNSSLKKKRANFCLPFLVFVHYS